MDNDLYFMRLEEEQQFSEPETMSSSPEGPLQMIGAGVLAKERRFSWPWLAALLLFACGLGWFGYSKGFSLAPPRALQAASVAPIAKSTLKTERIADLKVGLRVLAQNPEIPGETPPPLEIPDPGQWRLFTLEQQKEEGKKLRIELLRPITGIAAAVLAEEDLLPPTIGLPFVAEVAGLLQPAVRLPARTVAFGADLGWQLSHAPDLDKLLIGKTLDLDLPEMGAMGEAKIVAIAPCPEIEKGEGRVITGRFIHQAANVVDLKITSESEPIGTTDNHPFWSEDRRDYVPAGELRVGETLRTVNGSQTYVQSIRPRGPPEDVYNLEVEGAHTYHVGNSGVLVHNTCLLGKNMIRDGVHRNWDNVDAHHIIPKNSKIGKEARDIMSQWGFTKSDLDESFNGVWLKRNRKVSSSARGLVHSTIHTREYGIALAQRLSQAGSRADVFLIIQKIRNEILLGTFPY